MLPTRFCFPPWLRLARAVTLVVACGLAAALPAQPPPAPSLARPRLLAPPERLAALRQEIANPGHAQTAFAALLQRVRTGVSAYSGRDGYARSALAREAAFAWLVTRDRAWADLAFTTLQTSRRQDEDQPDRGYGLSRAMMSMAYALAYDWCYEGWSPAQRAEIFATLRAAADAWPNFQHANVAAPHRGSNWVGVTRGAELILHLAARREPDYGDRADRIALCVDDLTRHIETAYGPSGWTQEGLGYLEYTFGFLAPAALAARDAGWTGPWAGLQSRRWHRLLWMAGTFRAQHQMLQSGVAGEASTDEGLASLVWPFVPADERASYRWFYDRHLGTEALRPTFDSRRAGTTWALLFYPSEVRPAPPPPEPLFDSKKGAYYFRNRWQDQNDILISLMARHDTHSHAWQQPETWALAIMAFDTTFAAGPVKERDPARYSQLLINGKTRPVIANGARELSARPAPHGGGTVISDAAGNLGLQTARRRLDVDFSGERGFPAVLEIEDELADPQAFFIDWQLRSEPGVTAEVRSGPPGESAAGFILRGKSGWLRGWVLAPANVEIFPETGIRVRVPAANTIRLKLLLALGQGPEPTALPAPNAPTRTLPP